MPSYLQRVGCVDPLLLPPSWLLLIYVCDVTHSCVTWPIYGCDVIHPRESRGPFMSVTWPIHTCGMCRPLFASSLLPPTHACVWRGSFMCLWRDSFVCETWSIHNVTHSHVWRDLFSGPIHVCDVAHSRVWRNPFMCVAWFIHTYDLPHLYVWHNSGDMTNSYVWHDSGDMTLHMCD